MPPIPPHLAKYDWYAPHIAWCVSVGYAVRHDPGDAKPARLVWVGSNLSGSNLSDSDLRGSNLSGSNLSDSNLRGSDLRGSNLRGSNLRGAVGVASREECIARLDEIRKHVIEHNDPLDTSTWHSDEWTPDKPPEHACQTAHCLAGWAQALHPDSFVRAMNPVDAGVKLIPLAAPLFWSDNETVRDWLANREYAQITT